MMIHVVYATAMISGGWPRSILKVMLALAELWWLKNPVLDDVNQDGIKAYLFLCLGRLDNYLIPGT